MTEASLLVGTIFLAIGAFSIVYGAIACYLTKVKNCITLVSVSLNLTVVQGEYFNDEEVRMMLAREAEEERRRREEEMLKAELDQEEDMKDEGKRRKRGIIIAS